MYNCLKYDEKIDRDLLVIIPSRGRPDVIAELAEEFFINSVGFADLLIGTDDDDVDYPTVEGVLYERGPRLRLNGTLNKLSVKYAGEYEYIGFAGDDHRFRTDGWDENILSTLDDMDLGVVYGNDLLQGENLPTAVFMTSEIVKRLGYMSPPGLVHLYMDNFWLEIGKATNIKYLHDTVIEHMHPLAGKADWDDRYLEVNSNEVAMHDRKEFERYMVEEFQNAVALLREEKN
jgi:hypothetical protein